MIYSPNARILLILILNTRLGGKIYIGVKRCGLIRGIVLERKKRDVASY